MPATVYIDGHVGTTGLRIRDWLANRPDLDLLTLPEAKRKDASARREAITAADIAVLCLPDDAAREAATWAAASDTRLIDASTAHRVSEDWVYGLPELCPGQRERIAAAPRVTNPGCYPTGYLLLLRPLVDAGLVPTQMPAFVHAVSGYTGGGRTLIEKWEDSEDPLTGLVYEAPYALDRLHKHVPEMQVYSGLEHAPQFVPSVGPFRCGMRIQVPIPAECLELGVHPKAMWEALEARYRDEPFVHVEGLSEPLDANERSFDPERCNDTNRIDLQLVPHPSGHVLLIAILDNLGKGAAGAAIQNLNLMLGLPETQGLTR